MTSGLNSVGPLGTAWLSELGSESGAAEAAVTEPREKKGPFWQLSYTHQMKSRFEYVRPHELASIRQEVTAFRPTRN